VKRSHDRAARAASAGGGVLVVDNASTDATPDVLAKLVAENGDGVRTVVESQLGLSVARNRGLAEARGAVVVYLDDDAIPRPGWLAALLAPYRDPRVVAVGGRIVLRFPDGPPAWLSEEIHPALSAFDLGPAPRAVRYGQATYPYGANISFRADLRATRAGSRRGRPSAATSSSTTRRTSAIAWSTPAASCGTRRTRSSITTCCPNA
jgi:glycosyltransferase involved in cell wall biosynthesis